MSRDLRLGVPVPPADNAKVYKQSGKSMKKYSKSIKKAEKTAAKRLKRNSKGSASSVISMEAVAEEMPPSPAPGASTAFEQQENPVLRERRGSLKSSLRRPKSSVDSGDDAGDGGDGNTDDEEATADDDAQIWTKGSLAGVLKHVPESALPRRVSMEMAGEAAVAVPEWDCRDMGKAEALSMLTGQGAGSFVVRFSDVGFATLSMVKPDGNTAHFRLEKTGGGLCIKGAKNHFAELAGLIRHYGSKPRAQLPCKLRVDLSTLGDNDNDVDDESEDELDPNAPVMKRAENLIGMAGIKAPDRPVRGLNVPQGPSETRIANHILPTSGDKTSSVESRRVKAVHSPAKVNEQVRGAKGQAGKKTQYSKDAREQKRQKGAQALARTLVNDQVRATEPGTFDANDAEVTRINWTEENKPRPFNSQVRTDPNARARTPEASWAGKVLAKGDRHEVPDAAATLDWNRGAKPAPPPVLGHAENHTPFYFENMYDKEDAEGLLHMAGQNGIFLLRPHIRDESLQFNLSVRLNAKVTHHMLSRSRAGGPFTVCCMPYALTNEVLDRRSNCVTLADVVRHLQVAQEYWPMPLTSGIQAPKGKALESLMQQLELYHEERAAQKANKSSLSSKRSSGSRPQELASFIAPAGPAPTSPKKEKKKPKKAEAHANVRTETRMVKRMVKKKKDKAPSHMPDAVVSYFHAIKKKAAETLIEADNGCDSPGKFLIRAKDEDEDLKFVISVVFKGSVTHHKLERGDVDENFKVNGKLNTNSTELNGAVDFLRTKRKGWPIELGEGVLAAGSGGGGGGNDDGAGSESEYEEVEVEVEVEVAAAPEGGADAAVAAEEKEEDVGPRRDVLEYKVTIVTGKAAGSDTSGTVHIQLSGSLGEGANHKVAGRRRRDPLFQLGQEFTFTLASPDVGDVRRILLTHDGKSSKSSQTPDWFVDTVVVERAGVSQDQWHIQDTFSCNAWINKAEGLSRSFEVAAAAAPTTAFAMTNASVELQRNRRNNKEYSDRHAVNANARGANIGNQHKFDNNAREMRRQKEAGGNTFDVRKVHGIARGSGGAKSGFDNNSAEMSRMMNAPKTNAQTVNPQQLIPGLMSRDKKADAVHSQGSRQAVDADAEIEAGKVSVSALRALLPSVADPALVSRPVSTHDI